MSWTGTALCRACRRAACLYSSSPPCHTAGAEVKHRDAQNSPNPLMRREAAGRAAGSHLAAHGAALALREDVQHGRLACATARCSFRALHQPLTVTRSCHVYRRAAHATGQTTCADGQAGAYGRSSVGAAQVLQTITARARGREALEAHSRALSSLGACTLGARFCQHPQRPERPQRAAH